MMLDLGHPEKVASPRWRDWWPAALLGGVILVSAVVLLAVSHPTPAGGGMIGVRDFARSLFQQYGIAVEVISMQLLFALVGALYLGRRR
jgi:NADH-quinone oxidoreductase subunit J